MILGLLTNEPGVAYSVQSFDDSLHRIIDHERGAAIAPSVLIYAPLQDGIAGQAPYYPVLSRVAMAENTAYFDLRQTYGLTLLPEYFGPDMDHENNAGHDAVYQQMLKTLLP